MTKEKELLTEYIESLEVASESLDSFEKYYNFLIRENQKINLTSLTSPSDVYIKHFYDSLLIAKYVDLKSMTSLCDIGTGAGFPAIPLKIIYPHLKLLLVDSLKKRTKFLAELVQMLGLTNVEIIHGRAEDLAHQPIYRERYNIVASRAVAGLEVLSEYCMPFVRKNGYFVAAKGPRLTTELEESRSILKILGSGKIEQYTEELPQEHGSRYILKVQKVKKCPMHYPRAQSVIKKKKPK